MRICLVGCCHGELDRVYDVVIDKQIDLVLIAGDFQAVRDVNDLESMAVPRKYRKMGDFEHYYKGTKTAPVLTIIIGGNHEASRHMLEHNNGGWLAENIYYLGRVGVIDVGGITIGGLSGIWAPEHYEWAHFEKYPFTNVTVRSVYHIRRCDVERLLRMPTGEIDIMMSHDWPAGIEHYGDLNRLLKVKKFLEPDIARQELGSPPAMQLLQKFQPKFWLSAHLHVKYMAQFTHSDTTRTEFIALDKAESRRQFYHIIDMPSTRDISVSINKAWQEI